MPRRRVTPRPPAVSGPGALSQRTDLAPQGAAGARGQPLRAATGGDFGARKETLDQQRGAPLAAVDATTGAPPRLVDAVNAPLNGDAGVFGGTARPNEPITAGVPFGPGVGPQPINAADPDWVLQAQYGILPHPAIARLMMSDGGM